MIKHYLKIAWRNLQRQKILTLINISGLSIGLACFSLFLLYSVNEFSFDRFHVNAKNIYRVYDWWDYGDRVIWAGGICIFLACMGLIGLISLTVVNRSVEIGIRKVNGARISEVMTMLNKDFVKWVAIAFVIATPVSYYAMNKWLENFAYKTELSWWIFALAGLLALGIALLTVSFQSWKAATKNPVESLRYE